MSLIFLALLVVVTAAPSEPATLQEPTADGERAAANDGDAAKPRQKRPLPPARGLPPLVRARHALVYTNLFGARYNALGAVDQFRLSYRYRLFASDSPLLEPANVTVGFTTNLTPAFARAGVHLDVMPMAALQLGLTYEVLGYFGNFQNVFSAATPTAAAADADRNANAAAGLNQAAWGSLLTLNALLQAKLGPIAVRSQLTASNIHMRDLTGPYFYEAINDLLVPSRGWFLSNDADLLYISKFGLFAGVRYSLSHAFYDDPAPRSGPGFGNLNSNHRIGPLLLYQFFDEPEAMFSRPAVVVMVQWWLQHRYRAGVETAQGIPQITVAFLFQGKLLDFD